MDPAEPDTASHHCDDLTRALERHNMDAFAPPRDRRHEISRRTLLTRIDQEFVEMPGLRLTIPQASRLWALAPDTCRRLLGELERRGILKRTPKDAYCRRDLGS